MATLSEAVDLLSQVNWMGQVHDLVPQRNIRMTAE